MTIDSDAAVAAARHAWSLRVRRIGGFIQAAFAGFWLIRGSLVLDGPAQGIVPVLAVIIVIAAFAYGFIVTRAVAPRPPGPEAHRLERDITIATVVQLVASFVAPAIAIAADHSDWTLPVIAITIGPLLLWLDYRVDLPRYRPVGWALIIGPVVLMFALSGVALIATTGLSAGALLLGTALLGFHDLAQRRPAGAARPPAPTATPTRA